MPPIGSAFGDTVDRTAQILQGLETLRDSAPNGSPTKRTLTPTRLEFAYEAGFLRVFTQWESLLEESTLRYMCGYTYLGYIPAFPPLSGKQPNLTVARSVLFGSNHYLLWHNATKNANRVAGRLMGCPIENVMRSSLAWLEPVSHVRHRIAHDTQDSRAKFDLATLHLAGRRLHGGSVGRFLRGTDPTGASRRFNQITGTLKRLAIQVAP